MCFENYRLAQRAVFLNSVKEILVEAIDINGLREVSENMDAHRVVEISLERGQNDNQHIWILLLELNGELESAHFGHLDINKSDVIFVLVFENEFSRLTAVYIEADSVHFFPCAQQFFNLFNYFRAVVADKYIYQKNHTPANIIPHFVEKANRKIKNVISDYFLLFAGHRLN